MNYLSWKHAAPSFLNMTIDAKKTNRESIFKAIMENAAIVSLENLNTIRKFTKIDFDCVRFAGGASKDPVWCQILADVLQLDVHTTKVKEATALGAAMCGAIGIGMYKKFDEVSEAWIRKGETYTPNIKNKNVYEDLLYRFRKAYEKQLELADSNITTHMWKAAGE